MFCFKYKYYLYCSNSKEERQEEEEINCRSAVKERSADNMANSCGTFEVRNGTQNKTKRSLHFGI